MSSRSSAPEVLSDTPAGSATRHREPILRRTAQLSAPIPPSFVAVPATLADLESFGAIDAESDFRPEFFVPSTTWERVLGRTRPIVVGRKGTGKTAVRLALLERAASDPLLFAADLVFRDYPWAVHHTVFDETVGGRSRFQETWLFLMLVETAKAVLIDESPKANEATAAALRKFVELNWGSVTFSHKDVFRAEEYTVTSNFAPQVAGTGVGGVNWTKLPRKRLGDSLGAMNQWLKVALTEVMNPEAQYFLAFDELDLDFDPNEEDYLDSMIGLMLAAQTYFLWARHIGAKATPIVLMRDDIYARLQFPDKNKITHSFVESILWDPSPVGANSLKTVVDTRIRVLLEEPDAEDPWYLVFDEDVMRGTQHKYAHMVQRTYLRPRDLIQFANLCLAAAKRRLRDEGGRISNVDVTNARVPYSNYLRAELGDEIHAHFPEWEKWLELLRRVGTLTFGPTRFRETCEGAQVLTAGSDADEILGHLYEFGVIGFARRGGAGRGGTDEYWRYRDPEVTFDAGAPYFRVHPGLKENLDLKEERKE